MCVGSGSRLPPELPIENVSDDNVQRLPDQVHDEELDLIRQACNGDAVETFPKRRHVGKVFSFHSNLHGND